MRSEDVVVGKTYRIRQWDDMEKEFGLTESGSIKCKLFFCERNEAFVRKEVHCER